MAIRPNRADLFFRTTFSLIELLVIVAIIALLSAMLLPALGKARAMGARAVCANNMKQIGCATMLYVSDYNDRLPPGRFTDWSALIAQTLNLRGDRNIWFRQKNNPTWETLKGTMFCPSTPMPSNETMSVTNICPYTGQPMATSYAVTLWGGAYDVDPALTNSSWGGWQYNYETFADRSKKVSQVKDNSVILLEKQFQYVVGNAIVVPDVYWSRPAFTAASYLNYSQKFGPNWRHNLAANFLFIDGHVAIYKIGRRFNENWQLE